MLLSSAASCAVARRSGNTPTVVQRTQIPELIALVETTGCRPGAGAVRRRPTNGQSEVSVERVITTVDAAWPGHLDSQPEAVKQASLPTSYL